MEATSGQQALDVAALPVRLQVDPYYNYKDIMSSRPELAELSSALETLSQEEVRYMCIQLGVESHTLNTIDCNHRHDALTCITKYLEALLDCDSCLTWARVVEVLRSKRLNKSVLADRIMKKYCPSSSAAIAIASPSHQSCSASSMSCEDSVSSDSSSSVFEANLSPLCSTLHQGASDHETQQDSRSILPVQHAVIPRCLSQPEGHKLKRISKEASGLMKRFRSVVIKANVCLTEKEVSPRYLKLFKIDLTKLPMLTKYKKLRFLQKKKRKIMRAKSIQDVFDILDPYWNYVDYSLLEYIVKKYCDNYVKKQMQKYKRKLHEFERETSVQDFTSALPHNHTVPKNYCTLQATLKLDATKCTLHRIRKVKKSLAERASLEPYVALMQGIHTRSVLVMVAFPRAARKHVKKSLDRTFLQGLDIIPESVHYMDTKSVKVPDKDTRIPDLSPDKETRIPDLSPLSVQENFHATAMPDPPQDVREELTYTIRRRDLKPVYRDSGPQLVQKHCSEIESKSHHVSIEVQWKPEEVEFHIAGLEEGVTRAIHLIQERYEELRSAIYKSTSSSLLGFDEVKDTLAVSEQPPTSLTEEALREHEILTSLRQFSCRACHCDWWSDVPASKEVSRCKRCNGRYDPLPRDKEYGVGRFTCPNEKCGNVFFNVCNANSNYKCLECGTKVNGPYLHPSNEQKYETRHAARILGVFKKQYSSYSRHHISPVSTKDTGLLIRSDAALSDSSGTSSSIFYSTSRFANNSYRHYRHTNTSVSPVPSHPKHIYKSSYYKALPSPSCGYYFDRASTSSSPVNLRSHFPRSASQRELSSFSPASHYYFRRTASTGYYDTTNRSLPMYHHRKGSYVESLASSACSSRG